MRVRGTPTPHGPTSRYSEPENGAEIPKPGPKPGPTGSAGTDPVPLSRAPRTTAPGSPRRGGQRPAGGGDPAPACPCRAGPGRAGAMPRPEVAGSYQEVGDGVGVLAAGGALPGVFAAGWGRWTGGRAAERSSPPG